MKAMITLTVIAGAITLPISTSFATPSITEVQKLLASDGMASDKFGIAIDREGDLMIIGAPQHFNNSLPGSFYVFTRDSDGVWIEQERVFSEFTPGDDKYGDEFGSDLSLEGDTLLISAYISRKTYIYKSDETGSWSLHQQLELIDLPDGSLGREVALLGEIAIVIGHDGSQAKGFLFSPDDNDVWVHTETLDLGMLDMPNLPGKRLAFDGETIAISDGTGGQITPVVAFFRNDGDAWTFDQSLTMPMSFLVGGLSGLAIEDETLAVGLIEGAQNTQDHVRIYELDDEGAWAQPDAGGVLDPTSVYTDSFGSKIALAGNLMLIGAPNNNGPGTVWVYERGATGEWSVDATLAPSDESQQLNNNFGGEISFIDNTPIVGTSAHHENGLYSGAVYVFDPIPAPAAPGDIDGDGDVDFDDFTQLLASWGEPGCNGAPACPADIDGDGDVDFDDFTTLLANWS